jgi:hypothetical protein
MNFRLNDGSASSWVCSRLAGIALLLSSVGCSLIGVEPDEIDLAMGSESEGAEATGDSGVESNSGPDDTGQSSTEGDTGDAGGDGDGDGDPEDQTPCEDLGALELNLGPNDVMVEPGPSVLMGSCGHGGPEGVYAYTSDAAVNLELTLTTDFDAALYAALGTDCLPLTEGGCVNTPDALTVSVGVGETIYVIVDSATPDGGSGTLDIAIVP